MFELSTFQPVKLGVFCQVAAIPLGARWNSMFMCALTCSSHDDQVAILQLHLHLSRETNWAMVNTHLIMVIINPYEPLDD